MSWSYEEEAARQDALIDAKRAAPKKRANRRAAMLEGYHLARQSYTEQREDATSGYSSEMREYDQDHAVTYRDHLRSTRGQTGDWGDYRA